MTTSDPAVKATVYLKPDGGMLVALANFGQNDTSVKLAFNASRSVTRLHARVIEAFQVARAFGAAELVPVAGKRGWLLEVEFAV